ncbi:MAG: acyltransferase [Legionella sp.]|nr:MAG: acyltransferase [Legionella sp.]
MNLLIRLLICFMALSLSGCNTLSISNKPCAQMCVQKLNHCKSSCVNNCPACSSASRYKTATNYSKYVHQQRIQGQIIARELNSYRDPLQCRKTTCNCSADFSTCIQACTGVIKKRLQAVPYCT